jgi:hypothetical protein
MNNYNQWKVQKSHILTTKRKSKTLGIISCTVQFHYFWLRTLKTSGVSCLLNTVCHSRHLSIKLLLYLLIWLAVTHMTSATGTHILLHKTLTCNIIHNQHTILSWLTLTQPTSIHHTAARPTLIILTYDQNPAILFERNSPDVYLGILSILKGKMVNIWTACSNIRKIYNLSTWYTV